MNGQLLRSLTWLSFSLFLVTFWLLSFTAGTVAAIPPLRASITVDASKSIRLIPKTLFGTNVEWKWDGNGIWDRKRGRLQGEIVKLTRAMHLALIRYPGGTLSDYYHWREGIGPIEKRPFLAPLPGEDKSQLVFGTDEALEFAKRVGAHLLITVNMAMGSAEEAAAWVEYINKKRAAHDESKRVTYWELGNENYIRWVPGVPVYFRTSALSAEQYVERVKSYAEAMKAIDPSIKLIGILDSDPKSKWNHKVLAEIADRVDYVALHNGYAPGFVLDSKVPFRELYRALLAKPLEIRENLRAFSRIIESLGQGPAENLKLAVTEWGPIFSVDLQSPYLNHTQTLGSGLYAASVLMALIDSPRTKQAQDPLNPRYAKGGPGEVEVKGGSLTQVRSRFRYVFPPRSVTVIEIRRAL